MVVRSILKILTLKTCPDRPLEDFKQATKIISHLQPQKVLFILFIILFRLVPFQQQQQQR